MEIEAGEYFVITRGREIRQSPSQSFVFTESGFDHGQDPKPEQKEFDRGHDGNVYLAVAISGAMIAAKCVYSSQNFLTGAGKIISLNSAEIEIWPVSNQYVEAFGIQTKNP